MNGSYLLSGMNKRMGLGTTAMAPCPAQGLVKPGGEPQAWGETPKCFMMQSGGAGRGLRTRSLERHLAGVSIVSSLGNRHYTQE